jgi:hypothetical protein
MTLVMQINVSFDSSVANAPAVSASKTQLRPILAPPWGTVGTAGNDALLQQCSGQQRGRLFLPSTQKPMRSKLQINVDLHADHTI